MPAKTPELVRFLTKVSLSDGCWEWRGHRGRGGYGYMRRSATGRPGHAHRAAYELFVGPIPTGLHLDHLCRNPGCVNPAHLEPVTPHENALRGERATRTHCEAGHEYTPDNLFRGPYGDRRCRACKRRHNADYRARRRAA